MANLLDLLRKRRFDRYNQAIQSSPYRPTMSSGDIWSDPESKRAQLLLANPDDLDLNTQIAKVHGPSAQFSEAYYLQGEPRYNANLVGENTPYHPIARGAGQFAGDKDALLTGTDEIYKRQKLILQIGKTKQLGKPCLNYSSDRKHLKSLGRAGGKGGGPYKVALHDIVQDVTPSQGVFDPERKKRSWNLMMRGMV